MSTEHIGTGPEGVAGGSLSDSDGEQWRTDAPTADPDATADESASEDDDAVYYEEQVEPEYGILGFTLRELIIVGAWVVVFVVSFFPVFGGGGSVWTRGIDWILTIGLPTVAVFLIALRRFSPEGIRRVGSLGIDQFASVASSVAAVAWAQLLWLQSAASVDSGAFLVGWVPIVAQLATLAMVAATVAAPLIPRLRDDFEGRMETLAHRNANPVRPVITRPRPAAVTAPAASGTDADAPADPIVETDLAQPRPGGAIYSRYPIRRSRPIDPPPMPRAEIHAPRLSLDFTAVHTVAPMRGKTGDWAASLGLLPHADEPGLQVLAGDFNATLDHEDLRSIVDSGYADAAQRTGDGLASTWPVGRAFPPGVPIDHVLADNALEVLDYRTFEVPGTDHRAVYAEVARDRS